MIIGVANRYRVRFNNGYGPRSVLCEANDSGILTNIEPVYWTDHDLAMPHALRFPISMGERVR